MATKKKQKTYKFAQLRAEADKRSAEREPQRVIPPFVLDDISPPIVITAPDTLERQLVIAEMIGPEGHFQAGQALPLLRALCGEAAFPRVWALIKNDKNADTAIRFVQTLIAHFYEAIEGEAAELPGGSEGSLS
jgi:hypothetical protein